MASILHNISALRSSRQLGVTNAGLQQTLERLTTGRRINRASDDAAGLGIANKLDVDTRIAGQGRRNANDGVYYLRVADGVLDEVTNMLMRAAELAEQAKAGTITDSNRTHIDAEFQRIITSLADIGEKTQYNGNKLFSDTSIQISVGGFSPVAFAVGTLSDSSTSALGMTAGTTSVSTAAGANAASGLIRTALDKVSLSRAQIGAQMNQLGALSNALGIQVENFTAASSQIRDAEIADEVVNLAKFQILSASGTSALSKSNEMMQQVLSILR